MESSGRKEEAEKAEAVVQGFSLSLAVKSCHALESCFTIRPCHSLAVDGRRETSDQEPCFVVPLFFAVLSFHTHTHTV